MTDSTDIRITALTLAVQVSHGPTVAEVVECAKHFLAFLEPAASARRALRKGDRSRWTPQIDDEIRRLVAEGVKGSVIAHLLGMTTSAVQIRRYRLGLTHPTPKQIASLELARGSRNAMRNGASPA